MSDTSCPNCGSRVRIAAGLQGAEVRCPACGRMFSAPIEVVEFEVVEVRTSPGESRPASEPIATNTYSPNTAGPGAPRPGIFVFQREFAGGGGGCCGCGCLGTALVVLVIWAILNLLADLF